MKFSKWDRVICNKWSIMHWVPCAIKDYVGDTDMCLVTFDNGMGRTYNASVLDYIIDGTELEKQIEFIKKTKEAEPLKVC